MSDVVLRLTEQEQELISDALHDKMRELERWNPTCELLVRVTHLIEKVWDAEDV